MKTFDEAVNNRMVGCGSDVCRTWKMAQLSKQGGSELGFFLKCANAFLADIKLKLNLNKHAEADFTGDSYLVQLTVVAERGKQKM